MGVSRPRDGTFELFRVAALYLITWVHGVGPFKIPMQMPAVLRLHRAFFISKSMAQNYLMILSGYFGVKSRGFNVRRLLLLYLSVRFYSRLAYEFATRIDHRTVDFWTWLVAHFPILGSPYWYTATYVQVQLISPALNYAARSMSYPL
jgi:hypothetical protein